MYKSLYPSLCLENNIAPNTQIGKIDIPNQVHNKENPYMEEKYNRGGNFLDDYGCDYTLEFAHRWLGLGTYQDMLDDIDEYFSANSIGPLRELYNNNCPILPTTSAVIEPIKFYNDSYKPIIMNVSYPEGLTYENIVNNGGIK